MCLLDVLVGPYLAEGLGDVLLLLGDGSPPHHGVGQHRLVLICVIDHKNTNLVTNGLLSPGQLDYSWQSTYFDWVIWVDRFT